MSAVIGIAVSTSRLPKHFEIYRLAMALDQNDGAGNLAGGDFVVEESVEGWSFSPDSSAPGGRPKAPAAAGNQTAAMAAATIPGSG